MEENRKYVAKQLRLLRLAQTVLLVNMLLAPIQLPLRLVGWITMAMTAVTGWALYSMNPLGSRYYKASVCLAVGLAGDLLSEFTGLNLIASLLGLASIVSQYEEYHAHSELMAECDLALAGKWPSLFYWQLGVGLLSGLGSVLAVLIAVAMDVPENTIITAVLLVVALMAGAVQFVYLRYLKRMLKCFEQ